MQYVIQNKLPNLYITNPQLHQQQQQSYQQQTQLNIKTEPPESPNLKNLPATPKSNEQMETDANAGDYNKEEEDEAYDAPEKKFILAPTPAQLGKAPLQRRLNSRGEFEMFANNYCGKFQSCDFSVNPPSIQANVDSYMETNLHQNQQLTSVPSALPTPTSASYDDYQNQISPSVNKSNNKLYKGRKPDDMDKWVATI